MTDRERYLIFVQVHAEVVEKCMTTQENGVCFRCPFYENHRKCIKWEENMDDLSANDVHDFLHSYDEEVHPTDMQFDYEREDE